MWIGETLIKLMQGGVTNVQERLLSPARPAEGIGGLVGIVLGFAAGYWGWKKFSLGIGFLSPAQLEELYKPE